MRWPRAIWTNAFGLVQYNDKMSVLTSGADSRLVAEIERNYFGVMRYWGENFPGAEVVDEPHLLQFTTGIPVFIANTVVSSVCGVDEVEALVRDTLNKNQARGLPMCWFVQPSSRPASLGATLEAAGFSLMTDMPGMSVDLASLPDLDLGEGVEIKEVDSLELLEVWGNSVVEGFKLPELLKPFFTAPSEAKGFGPEVSQKNYVAFLNGEPVGTSALFITDEVAGIFCVSTVERARGKGIGRAITLAPLLEAKARGCTLGVLQASKMGEPVYRKLGFEERARFQWWVTEHKLTT